MRAGANCMTAGSTEAAARAQPTVGAGFARGLFELAVSRGAPRSALAARAGLDLARLEDRDARMPFAVYVALMRAAKTLAGDPALGLHYGEAVDISTVSIVGLIGQASCNLKDAFAQLNRYVRLIVETENAGGEDRFQFVRDAAGLWLVDTRLNPNDFPELTESAFSQFVCGTRRVSERAWVKAVCVTHPDPGYADEYARIFRASVTFGADRNALLVDAKLVSQPTELLPHYVRGVLTGHADGLIRNLESSKSVRGRVESLLAPSLEAGPPSLEAVAARLAVSRQTLYRRLKAEGVTFEQVLDGLRRKLALDYLQVRKLSVNETGYRLGFSDPAAFSRAFKRWTGRSPSEARGGESA